MLERKLGTARLKNTLSKARSIVMANDPDSPAGSVIAPGEIRRPTKAPAAGVPTVEKLKPKTPLSPAPEKTSHAVPSNCTVSASAIQTIAVAGLFRQLCGT
jgi:hypothetical protein